MHKTLALALLLMSGAWLPTQREGTAQAPPKNVSETTLQGCLSTAGGEYFVIDSSGVKHQLSGYDNKLKAHLGHEVQVSGKPSVKTVAATSYGAASSAEEIPVFEVKSVKRVADACKTY